MMPAAAIILTVTMTTARTATADTATARATVRAKVTPTTRARARARDMARTVPPHQQPWMTFNDNQKISLAEQSLYYLGIGMQLYIESSIQDQTLQMQYMNVPKYLAAQLYMHILTAAYYHKYVLNIKDCGQKIILFMRRTNLGSNVLLRQQLCRR